MNRTIKFRVWDIKNREWLRQMREVDTDFRYWESSHQDIRFALTLDWIFAHSQFWTAQQFTGLKDKNNKDIYEGDIVRVKIGNRCNLITEVIYMGGQFSPFPLSDDCPSKVDEAEVVGNIFENPDLLNVKTN